MKMRNLLLIVLVVNLSVFLYYFYNPDSEARKRVNLPANVSKLVLLSEVDKASLTSTEPEPEAPIKEKAVLVKEPVADKCFTIGPFHEQAKISLFESQIKDKVTKTGIRERMEKLHWRFWVYLSDSGSKEDAVKLASDLARKGLKDYYVIARGEYKNSISLGHFKDKTLAEKRLFAIKSMGYAPKIQTIEKEYTLYWLDYVAKNSHGLSGQVLESFDLEDSVHQFNRECQK